MSKASEEKIATASQSGKEKKMFMGKFEYSVLVYALYAACGIFTRHVIFEHTTWGDWIFEIMLFRHEIWVWILIGALPLGIVYLDEKIERRRNVFGAVTAILLPGALLAFLYIEQKNIRIALTAAGICAVIALLLALIVLPADKTAPRRLKLSRRFYLLATLMKRVVCVVVGAAFAFLCVYGTPEAVKTMMYGGAVEATVVIEGEEWADKCEVYKNYLCKLNPEKWGELSEVEKLEVLQCVVNLEAAYMGMTFAPHVSAEYIDGEGGILANYISAEEMIIFDIDHLSSDSYDECIVSAIHETRHGYQYNVVEAYASLDDKYNEMVYFSETKEWIDAMNSYPDTSDGISDDEMYIYSTNTLEEDAYIYANYNAGYYMAKSISYCIEQGTAEWSECLDMGSNEVRFIFFPHCVYFSNNIESETNMDVYGKFDSEEGFDDFDAITDSVETGYFDDNNRMDIRFVIDGRTYTFLQNYYGFSDVSEVSGSDAWNSRYVEWEENPIDRFYADYWLAEETPDDMYNFRYARAEVWKAEIYNAYELLNSGAAEYVSGTDMESLAAASGSAVESFLVYADAVVEADKVCQEPDEKLQNWSIQYLGSLYRDEALRVYKLAADYYDIKDAAEVFVFDAESFADMLSSEYGILLEEQRGG